MATAGDDGAVAIWDFHEVRLALRMRGHSGAVTSVAFAPDGKLLASAGRDKSVKFWDAATGQLLRTLSGHAGEARSVVFSPDGKLLASGGADSTVILWDAQSGLEQATLKGHTAAVNAVAFSPDGATLASASDDKTIRLWDVKTGALFQSLIGHIDPVLAVEFSPDGQRLASAAATIAPLNHHGTPKSWDATTGREVAAPPFRFAVSALAFRPDGKALALAYFGEDRLWNIQVVDVRGGEMLRHYVAHRRRITQLAYSPDGQWLVSVSADKAIRGWH
jgi:WD40 repeat protein